MKARVLNIALSLEIGGLERVVVDLCNALDLRRHEPFICCIRQAGPLESEFEYPHRLVCLSHAGRLNYSSLRKIVRLIRRERIDIVHCHNTAGLVYGFIPAKLCRVPLVHTVHGIDRDYQTTSLLNLLERIAMRSAKRVVCVSAQLEEFVSRRLGIPRDRVEVVHNGVPVGPRVVAEDRTGDSAGVRLGSVGRLSVEKNYGFLIESFADIRAECPRCSLTIVGGGREYERLRALRDSLSLEGAIELAGQTSDVAAHLERFDIFVLTSLTEGISLSILEAMARSKVCLASNVGGNGEIIRHGINGFLFESGNRSDFLKNMRYIIANLGSDAMRDIRRNARETVERDYSLRGMVARYEDLYDAVLGRP